MNRAAFEQLIEGQRRMLQFYEEQPRGCASCTQFQQSTQFCVRFSDKVPSDFQPKGCEQWDFNEVAF